MSFTVQGYREAGISVRKLSAWIHFFRDMGGWELQHQGHSAAATRSLWPEHGRLPVKEAVLGRAGEAYGRVRVFQFQGIEQVEIRGHLMPWDTGGIFDLDMRVDRLDDWHQRLTELGWGGIAPPVDWQFGDLSIREWLAQGPEAVVMALIQRLQPPLEGPGFGAGFGPAFNSSQTVSNMERAVHFYQQLGFKTVVDHRGPLGGGGGAVLGMEAEVLDSETVELVIMHPQCRMQGSIELVCLPERTGRRADELALPHNLGLNLLRFEVQGLEQLAAVLAGLPACVTTPIVSTELPPDGAVRMLATRSPDGAWLEFFEPV